MSKFLRFFRIASLTATAGLLVIGSAHALVAVDKLVIWTNHGRDSIECTGKGCEMVLNARADWEIAEASLHVPPPPPMIMQ